jgi:hypothetical protein
VRIDSGKKELDRDRYYIPPQTPSAVSISQKRKQIILSSSSPSLDQPSPHPFNPLEDDSSEDSPRPKIIKNSIEEKLKEVDVQHLTQRLGLNQFDH